MTVEYAPPGRRGFYGSWPDMGIPAGLVVATAVFTIFSSLPPEQFLSWGWRVPFLVSIVLVAVGLFVRLRILETPAFRQMQESGGGSQLPVVDVFRNHWKSLLLTMGAFFLLNGGFYVVVTFMLAYGTQTLGVDNSTMLIGVLIAGTVQIFYRLLRRALGQGRAQARVPRRRYLPAPLLLPVLLDGQHCRAAPDLAGREHRYRRFGRDVRPLGRVLLGAL